MIWYNKVSKCRAWLMVFMVICSVSLTSHASSQGLSNTVSDEQIITQMLHDFLANTVQDDLQNHDRFWANDLVYTSSSGKRYDKNVILTSIKADVQQPDAEQESFSKPKYWAEQIDIRIYGDTAVLAFKLGAELYGASNGTADTTQQFYFNTGTLLKRDGVWQVVAWQATKIPAE